MLLPVLYVSVCMHIHHTSSEILLACTKSTTINEMDNPFNWCILGHTLICRCFYYIIYNTRCCSFAVYSNSRDCGDDGTRWACYCAISLLIVLWKHLLIYIDVFHRAKLWESCCMRCSRAGMYWNIDVKVRWTVGACRWLADCYFIILMPAFTHIRLSGE